MRKTYSIVLFACVMTGAAGLLSSCSSAPKPVPKDDRQMAESYPQKGAQVAKMLAASTPSDADWFVAASYGTISDSVKAFRDYGAVDEEDFNDTLKDLGTHYWMNASKLSDFFKAGFDTKSGFVAGMRGDALFAVLAVDDQALFKKWWDNFTNEEFGRPTYTETPQDGKTIVHMDVLGKDFACYALQKDKPVVLVAGEGLGGDAKPSCEALNAILSQDGMGAIVLPDEPIVAWANTESLPDSGTLKILKDWVSQASAGIRIGNDGPFVRATAIWQDGEFEGEERGRFALSLADGGNGDWPSALLSASDGSAARLVIGAQAAETLAMAYMGDKSRRQYKDIKGKLTQRLLRLNVEEQVIHNIGSVWGLHMDDNSWGFAVTMKQPEAADQFFSKLNIIKGVVPDKYASITDEKGLLHAAVNIGDGMVLHVGYRDGLIVASLADNWPKMKQIYDAERKPITDEIALDKPILYGRAPVRAIAGMVNQKSLQEMLMRFTSIELGSEQNDKQLALKLWLKK